MSQLNPTQQRAVNHIEGPLLVIAGAGSGKTRIVTHRIAHLLSLGVPASEILAVTFTNKAAEEMKERLHALSNQMVLTSTFHSLGVRILRESIQSLDYDRAFHIYDADDSLELVKQCLKSLEIKDEKGLAKALKGGISAAKNQLKSPSDITTDFAEEKADKLLPEIFTLYQQKLKEYGAVDFDDLLFLPVKLFEEHPEILARYQKRWRFLLIDEYQDTNEAQYRLARLLTEAHNNIFVVGDPDQSIYSWRGANIANILNFEKDFPGAEVISLEQNYRSTETILKAANYLIGHNTRQYDKELWSDQGAGAKIGHYIAPSDRSEAQFVIDKILEHSEKDGISLNDCVIFYRTNFQSRLFEDALLKRGIPYAIIGGISFYARREIKDMLAFLRMIISESDFIAFSRTLNLPKRGIGPTTLTKLKVGAEEALLPILTFCRRLLQAGGTLGTVKLSAKQKSGLADYLGIIDGLKDLAKEGVPLNSLIRETIERTRYIEVLKSDPPTLEDRQENLNELVSKAAEWEIESDTHSPLRSFLEELTLKTSGDDLTYSDQILKLMTLHNSKGLEFSLACIVGMEEDLFPHANSKHSFDAVEEERRLCYVGITRAKQFLYLTASEYRFLWGSSRMMRPSRFLKELPDELLHCYHDTMEDEASLDEQGFEPEDFVFHKDFGKGIVQKSYQTSLGLTYDVYFPESEAMRTLVAKYAKLTPA